MNNAICISLALLCPSQASPSGLEMKVRFDTNVVARGDLTYCEIQIWNRTKHTLQVPSLAPCANPVVTVALDESHHETQHEPGGFGLPVTMDLPPDSMVTSTAQVILWDDVVLSRISAKEKTISGTIVLPRFARNLGVSPKRFTLRIENSVAPETFLQETLYQSGESRMKAIQNAISCDMFMKTADSISVEKLLTDSTQTATAIKKCLRQLKPNTALWRKAQLALLVIEYAESKKNAESKNITFEELKVRIHRIISPAGSSEQRFLILRCAEGIATRGLPDEEEPVKALVDDLPITLALDAHSTSSNARIGTLEVSR